MSTIKNNPDQNLSHMTSASSRRSRRRISGISAVAAVFVVVVMALAIFASHPHMPAVTVHATPTPPPSLGQGGVRDYLESISMVSPTNGWAVGQAWMDSTPGSLVTPLFYHDVNGVWQRVSLDLHIPAACNPKLNGVSMVTASDGWAVGGMFCSDTNHGPDSLVLHYDGNIWTRVTIPFHDTLQGVQMMSANEGWAFNGETGFSPPTLLHFLNGQWTIAKLPAFGKSALGAIMGFSVVSNQEAWAVAIVFGTSGPNDTSVFLHYQDGTWSIAQAVPHTDLFGIAMNSANDGWALGFHIKSIGNAPPSDYGTSFHYAQGTWHEESVILQDQETGGGIISVSPTENWVGLVGGLMAGTVKLYHGNGTTWTPTYVPLPYVAPGAITSFAGLPDGEVWAAGFITEPTRSIGLILHYSNGQWSVVAD